MATPNYPRRLIEVDLPIKRISAHARREKSIRHGHISTLHIWWARRPLAACRAVICASLWPDPADPLCPQKFRDDASRLINEFAQKAITDRKLAAHCSRESWTKWQKLAKLGGLNSTKEEHWAVLRSALFDFIADFANWDSSTVVEYLETSRALTQAAHEALGGAPGTKPLVVDPFAGGGSIPLETLRVGADAFACDLNPVAVLLNKIVLEYIPKYGQRLVDEVRKWGEKIAARVQDQLASLYPVGSDGARPIAYLWARTILCEGPLCGARVPLVRSVELDRKAGIQFSFEPDGKDIKIRLPVTKGGFGPTIRGGSAVCPVCGYVTPSKNVRRQLASRRGGSHDARLICCVYEGKGGRYFRLPTPIEEKICEQLGTTREDGDFSSFVDRALKIPNAPINPVRPSANTRGVSAVTKIGINHFADLFSPRQLIALAILSEEIGPIYTELSRSDPPTIESDFAAAVCACLACAVDRLADYNSSLCRWVSAGGFIGNAFTKQALSNVWDFAEVYPFSSATGSFQGAIEWVCRVIEANSFAVSSSASVIQADARSLMLPEASADAFITDPPYYAEIPYADISDFFYIWMKQSLQIVFPTLFVSNLVDKDKELIVTESCPGINKDANYFEVGFKAFCGNLRSITRPSGIGLIVFANAKTSAWESMLQAVLDGGLQVSASWPIDTEMPNRARAQKAASLQSSIHIVCRPRADSDLSDRSSSVADWRDVLYELPPRVRDWMTRLDQEGIAGADAIFACLGPALEIFSRYTRVEKASGERVTLKEYLEYIWVAVAKEALNMIFEGADATGFEEDARLTAMWLWTLSAGTNGEYPGTDEEQVEDEEEDSGKEAKMSGFVLQYDAARKIAQGLGAHLEQLTSLVGISGDKARLLPVSERARHLFGKEEGSAPTKRKAKPKQLPLPDLLGETGEMEGSWGEKSSFKLGNTVLDRIHQSMILFATDRGEALRRLLVTEGVGQDQRFWRLAQALSALYPKGTDEKRWVEGVLARKKGLGF